VQNLTRFLLDFFLIRNFKKVVRARVTQVQDRLSQIKAFSWEAMLLLSLFSWLVYLLVQSEFAKHLVSTLAWIFLMAGVDWALLETQIKFPLIGFLFKPGPWITAAIACIALLSNHFILHDWRSALISWPIFAAVFAGYSEFIEPGFTWQMPTARGRQYLVLLFLVCSLFSSWFQLHFLLQDILARYPNLRADSFSHSSFVVRLNPSRRPASLGYPLLDTTEKVIRENLAGKNWIEVQRWLRNIDAIEPALRQRVLERVYRGGFLEEQEFWQITADTTFNPTNIGLVLRANWQGPSSRQSGYTIQRPCSVTEAATPAPQSFEDLQKSTSYQLICHPRREVEQT
jgi:hypothetical protein